MSMPTQTNAGSSNRSAGVERRQAQMQQQGRLSPASLLELLRQYAKENPDTAALWCFGIGFVLGWKLKPW